MHALWSIVSTTLPHVNYTHLALLFQTRYVVKGLVCEKYTVSAV